MNDNIKDLISEMIDAEDLKAINRGLPLETVFRFKAIVNEISLERDRIIVVEYTETQHDCKCRRKKHEGKYAYQLRISVPMLLNASENGYSEAVSSIHDNLRLLPGKIKGGDAMTMWVLHELAHVIQDVEYGWKERESHNRQFMWKFRDLVERYLPDVDKECGSMEWYTEQSRRERHKKELEYSVPVGTLISFEDKKGNSCIGVVARYYDETVKVIDLLRPGTAAFDATRAWVRGNGYEVIQPSELRSLPRFNQPHYEVLTDGDPDCVHYYVSTATTSSGVVFIDHACIHCTRVVTQSTEAEILPPEE